MPQTRLLLCLIEYRGKMTKTWMEFEAVDVEITKNKLSQNIFTCSLNHKESVSQQFSKLRK